jgi:hypothetical protein
MELNYFFHMLSILKYLFNNQDQDSNFFFQKLFSTKIIINCIAKKQYADVDALTSRSTSTINEQLVRSKKEQYQSYCAKLENLIKTGQTARYGAIKKLGMVRNKAGRKEEEVFWGSQVKQGNYVFEGIQNEL